MLKPDPSETLITCEECRVCGCALVRSVLSMQIHFEQLENNSTTSNLRVQEHLMPKNTRAAQGQGADAYTTDGARSCYKKDA